VDENVANQKTKNRFQRRGQLVSQWINLNCWIWGYEISRFVIELKIRQLKSTEWYGFWVSRVIVQFLFFENYVGTAVIVSGDVIIIL